MEQVGGGTLPFFMALAEGFFNLPLPENYYINIYLGNIIIIDLSLVFIKFAFNRLLQMDLDVFPQDK